MIHLSDAEAEFFEREYVRHRPDVMGLLRAAFPTLADHEEIYQEAWTELLEHHAAGGRVEVRGLLRTIAWRRAGDRAKRRRPVTISPEHLAITRQVDGTPAPDEQAQIHLDAAVLRQIIDELEPRHALVLKLRFDLRLSSAEVQQQLGVSPKRLEKIVTAAYKEVRAHLEPDVSGESVWRRRQRSLLLACEAGIASERQRRRAQKMVDSDPVCRAMLHEMRSALEQVGAFVPLPVIVAAEPERVARLPVTLPERLAVIREHFADLTSKTAGHAQSIEQVGAGLAGGAGIGVAAKVAAVCVFTAGGTFACVESGLLRHDRPPPARAAKNPPARTTPPREPKPPVVATPTTPRKRTAPPRARASSSAGGSQSASAPPAPSPVQKGSSEFGPGAIGSTSAPTQPAAAPSGGGGEFLP